MNATRLGALAAVAITLGSFGGGAIRTRGGVLEWLGWEFLGFGRGAALSNVCLWLGTVLLIVAWCAYGKQLVHRGLIGTVSLPHTTAAPAARIHSFTEHYRALCFWIVPLVLAGPIMSRDVYSYLIQGTLLRDGFDPYTQGASFNQNSYLFEVSQDWRNTTTPYGPLHLWIGEGITRIAGDNVTVGVLLFKLISLAGFAAIAFAVPRIAAELGGNPHLALWLGVMNPVMIIHMVGGMHNESIMVGLVSVGLLLALRRKVLLGVAVISVGVAIKVTAAFALPFVVWIAVAHARKKVQAFFLYAAASAVVLGAVLWLVTILSGATWGWIAELTGNSKVINPLAVPSLLAGLAGLVASPFTDSFPYNQVLGVLRSASMVIMGLGMVASWWIFRRTRSQAIQGTAAAYTWAFTFNSVTLPWYYASIISLVGTFNPPLKLVKFVVGASIVVALAFTGSGNHQLYNPLWMAASIAAAWWATRTVFSPPHSPSSVS